MEERLIQLFRQIISEQTGLNIRDQDGNKFIETISTRTRSLRLPSPDEYYRFLIEDSEESVLERQELAKSLTTGETYFFRDRGQFTLLRNWILPELINSQRRERTLRLWSAGCSSGEEAYSLAILVDELIPDRNEWSIFILGTDINREAIEKGRRGVYGEWSFRGVDEGLRKLYFHPIGNGWEINEGIKRMVTLRNVNLITDNYPASDIQNMDIILCRNVFIYFRPEIISKVVEKMTAALGYGGYLMTGHAEVRAQELPYLKAKVFPEAVVYQKTAVSGQSSAVSERYLPEEVRRVELAVMSKPISAPTLPLKGQEFSPLSQGEGKGEGGFKPPPPIPPSALEQARAYADSGKYDEAVKYCNEAVKSEPFNAWPYYLLAQIAREKGEIGKEKEMLKRVIYLDPSHVAAFLESGIIFENEGDISKAVKMRKAALELLKGMPGDARIEPYTDFTVGELMEHLEKIVK